MQLGIPGLPRLAGFALDAAPSTFAYIPGGIPNAMEWMNDKCHNCNYCRNEYATVFGERLLETAEQSSPSPSLNSYVAQCD